MKSRGTASTRRHSTSSGYEQGMDSLGDGWTLPETSNGGHGFASELTEKCEWTVFGFRMRTCSNENEKPRIHNRLFTAQQCPGQRQKMINGAFQTNLCCKIKTIVHLVWITLCKEIPCLQSKWKNSNKDFFSLNHLANRPLNIPDRSRWSIPIRAEFSQVRTFLWGWQGHPALSAENLRSCWSQTLCA